MVTYVSCSDDGDGTRWNMIQNEVEYRSVVQQNKITEVFKILDKFRAASPFSRVQINTY